MARVTVDFSDVQDFDPLDKGEYAVLIEKAEYREAQTEDKYDYINLELTVTEEGEYKGRKLWMVLSFSPKALWRMRDIFENLGLYEDEIEVDYDDETMLVTEPELAGLPAVAVVSTRTYEGRIQNQVDALVSPDDMPTKKEPSSKKAPAKKTSEKKAPAKEKAGSKRRFK